ncbi:MAG: hypothetical protein V7K53_24050 [Nostoc sp.]|uniref:hypothetical protein n=1 Tax=Nostoc sp. TaxID=1180 RepID=UPI002FF1D0A2
MSRQLSLVNKRALEKQGVVLLGEEVEILKPLLYCGQRGRLLQREEMCHGDFSDRWLVLVDTEQESLILSLAAIEFRVCRET